MTEVAQDELADARRALRCLRLEVVESIAADVEMRVEKAFSKLSNSNSQMREAITEALELYDQCSAINPRRANKLRASLSPAADSETLSTPQPGYGG